MRLDERPELAARPATTADVTALSGAMARAFEDDPVYEWFLPDEATRLRKMIAINEALFPRMLKIDFRRPAGTRSR